MNKSSSKSDRNSAPDYESSILTANTLLGHGIADFDEDLAVYMSG
jgi:hypothetical protein